MQSTIQSPKTRIPSFLWIEKNVVMHKKMQKRKHFLAPSERHYKIHTTSLSTSLHSTPSIEASTDTKNDNLRIMKQNLLETISGTQRGSEAWPLKRGYVEEAQVLLESMSPPMADWSMLEGTWDVIFTTARDVLPIVKPGANIAGLPFKVGRVGQRFSNPEEGIVQNLIEVELFGTQATLIVQAKYDVRTARSIALRFQSAGLQDVVASDDVQNLLASPLLPRGYVNMQLLMALQNTTLQIPLATRIPGISSSSKQPVGINYNITYLDDDMLIGRAQGNGGTFIFQKRQ